jgi:hypothetical protein
LRWSRSARSSAVNTALVNWAMLAIADSGCDPFRRTNEMLCPFVSLLACEQRHAARIESDELPPEVMIGDVPSWAFDVYSREGRAALARFSN